jgi:Mg2+/citrate symporter
MTEFEAMVSVVGGLSIGFLLILIFIWFIDIKERERMIEHIENKESDNNKPPIKLTPIDTTTHRQPTKMDFIKANKESDND